MVLRKRTSRRSQAHHPHEQLSTAYILPRSWDKDLLGSSLSGLDATAVRKLAVQPQQQQQHDTIPS